ncbi:MAG: hypothetical protein FWD61_16200 [Phycisphaerales bacterium]|nr:hypothetical protein [Phycisphaerales bacterium]
MRISRAEWQRLFVMGMMLWLLSACAKNKPTLVVCVGGMGYSQLGDLRRTIIKQCPQAKVVNAGGWDGYKANLKKIATAKPRQHIIFIGHSFGCGAINDAAKKLPKVDITVFIDPAWSDFHLSQNILQYLWYKRSGIGIERQAKIIGASSPRVIKGGHNDIPHSPKLIAEVVQAINALQSKPAVVEAEDTSRNVAEKARQTPLAQRPSMPPPQPPRRGNDAAAPVPISPY